MIRWYGFHVLLVTIPLETRIVDLVLNICQVSRVLGTVNSTYLGLYGPVAKNGKRVRLTASRGAEQYQSTNSSIACRYPRYASGQERLLRTADFATSRSGNRSTVLAARPLALRFAFCFITRGLHRHGLIMYLLTSTSVRFGRQPTGILVA